jgi:hypothetical protein
MRIETPAWTRTGNAVDCRDSSIPARGFASAVAASPADSPERVRVICPPVGELHAHVGLLSRQMASECSRRRALAAAARSRGLTADVADELAAARRELAAVSVPSVDLTEARERVASAREAVESVQASVPAARGAVQARESLAADGFGDGADAEAIGAEEARARLESAITEASERETELLAAEQALDRERRRAREARDARERALELEDRVGNLERQARAQLVDAIEPTFTDARAHVRDSLTADGSSGSTGEGPSAAALDALAVVQIGSVEAPVVLAGGWFACADRARGCLDAPVILASSEKS